LIYDYGGEGKVRFQEPLLLLLLALIPILYWLYYNALKKKREAAVKFSSLGIIAKAQENKKFSWRKHIEFILTMLAIMFLIVGLSDPHIPLKRTHEGVNVVLSLDVSGSMRAEDYKPNRIESAKISANILIDGLEINDKVGVVIFENGATTASYLTPLQEKVKDKISAIQAKEGRTAIGDGLSLAVDMATSIPNKKKVVILLSDGVNNAGGISPDEAIKFAKENEIQVFTIGMGSEEKTVIGYDWFGNPQYAELDESLLKKIAKDTGGEYYKAVDDLTLAQIYKGLSQKIKREKEDTSIKDWFIGLALITLALLLYFRYGKYRIIR
jgi:Ca-activated chloride channel homolog